MVLTYEYGWGDDPCDITTSIVEQLQPSTILQVAGSGDHLLSFGTVSSTHTITAFDIDPRALALTDLKVVAARYLDFETMVRFFNMSSFLHNIRGCHNHPLLNPSTRMEPHEFKECYNKLRSHLAAETTKLLDEHVTYDSPCGFNSFVSFKDDVRLANPSVLPWTEISRYKQFQSNRPSIKLHYASLDPMYGPSLDSVINEKGFDFVWPINVLDHGVDFLPFLNFCLQYTKVGGYLMALFALNDPYIYARDAFHGIINKPSKAYANIVISSSRAPSFMFYVGDFFTSLGFEPESDLLKSIEKKYMPRAENVWWDDDINQSWSHRHERGIEDILFLYKRKEKRSVLSAMDFVDLASKLPTYFRRGFVKSTHLDQGL